MAEIDYRCVTHHYACDCREAKMQRIIEEAKKVIDGRAYLFELDMAIRDFEGRK
jgi:hypothetical protein